MLADDRRSARSSRDAYLFRRKHALGQPSRLSRTVIDDNVYGYAPFLSESPALGDLFVAPVRVKEYLHNFPCHLEARRLTAMHHESDNLDLTDARYDERPDTTLGPCMKRWLAFDRNGSELFRLDELQLHMQYVRCVEKCEWIVRLSTLVVLMKGVSDLWNQAHAYRALNWRNDVLHFMSKLTAWERDCYFIRGMQTACCPMFSGWHNAKIFAVSTWFAPFYTLVLEW